MISIKVEYWCNQRFPSLLYHYPIDSGPSRFFSFLELEICSAKARTHNTEVMLKKAHQCLYPIWWWRKCGRSAYWLVKFNSGGQEIYPEVHGKDHWWALPSVEELFETRCWKMASSPREPNPLRPPAVWLPVLQQSHQDKQVREVLTHMQLQSTILLWSFMIILLCTGHFITFTFSVHVIFFIYHIFCHSNSPQLPFQLMYKVLSICFGDVTRMGCKHSIELVTHANKESAIYPSLLTAEALW